MKFVHPNQQVRVQFVNSKGDVISASCSLEDYESGAVERAHLQLDAWVEKMRNADEVDKLKYDYRNLYEAFHGKACEVLATSMSDYAKKLDFELRCARAIQRFIRSIK